MRVHLECVLIIIPSLLSLIIFSYFVIISFLLLRVFLSVYAQKGVSVSSNIISFLFGSKLYWHLTETRPFFSLTWLKRKLSGFLEFQKLGKKTCFFSLKRNGIHLFQVEQELKKFVLHFLWEDDQDRCLW